MKSILIIGMGRFGKHFAQKFHAMGHQILAVDESEERINDALPYVTSALIGDSTSEVFLSSLGVNSFDVCIVAIGSNFQSSLETTSLLKELGAKKVVSRASREVHEKFLLRNGADEVLYPEKQMAGWAAIRYGSDHVLDYIELDGEHAVYEVVIPQSWLGKTVGQLDIRKKHNINIMGLRCGSKLDLSVTPNTLLSSDKTLMVLGRYKDVQKCFHI